jgi:pyridoxal phosphate enzyme (YggS family)
MTPARRAELAANLEAVRARIAAACTAAGRDPAEVTLIAVTKSWPARDVEHLAALGVRDVGENKDQEGSAKAAELLAGTADLDRRLRWHFVGRLQTNKCRSVAGWARVVHSLDRPRVVDALSAAATAAGRTVGALVQVDLDPAAAEQPAGGAGPPSAGRGGAAPADVPALAAAVASAPGLRLLGVMAVAPLGAPAAPAFARLAAIAADVRAEHPAARWISAGMTGDLEEAVQNGATHVRVGSALLGMRTSSR